MKFVGNIVEKFSPVSTSGQMCMNAFSYVGFLMDDHIFEGFGIG